MIVYTCCPESDCGGFQKILSFLHKWDIEPERGFDDEGHYLEFELPSDWTKKKEKAFRAAIAKRSRPMVYGSGD
jgi:hypothetical protein